MLDFTLSKEEENIRSMAAQFSSQVLATAWPSYKDLPTQKERFLATKPIYSQAVKMGLIKGVIPKELGGTSGSMTDAAIMVEEMYAVETSAAINILSTGLGLLPLIIGGSDDQKTEFLKPFLTGDGEPLASLVHSEPNGTANWLEKGGAGLQTVAWKEGSEWVISGEKIWATSSSGWDDRGADVQCVVCRHAREGEKQSPDANPRDAILILIVTRGNIEANDSDTYEVLEHLETTGHIATSGPHVRFSKLRVPERNLLAAPGKGADTISGAFTGTAAWVGAMATGIMRAAFEAALKFSKEDSRGGSTPILNRQSVADLLMNIKMRTDASRLLTWQACRAFEKGLGPELPLEAKIYCSDNAVKCVVDAMNAVGMSSYNKTSPFPRLMSDALCLPLFDGGNVGIRRRQLEKIFLSDDYKPWASTFSA